MTEATTVRDARYIEACVALDETIRDNAPWGVMLTPSQADALVSVLICGRFQSQEPENTLLALSTSNAMEDLVDALTGNEPVWAAVDPTYDTETF